MVVITSPTSYRLSVFVGGGVGVGVGVGVGAVGEESPPHATATRRHKQTTTCFSINVPPAIRLSSRPAHSWPHRTGQRRPRTRCRPHAPNPSNKTDRQTASGARPRDSVAMEKMARALVRLIGKVTSVFPFSGKIYAVTGAGSATVTCTDVEPLVVLSDSSVPASTHATSVGRAGVALVPAHEPTVNATAASAVFAPTLWRGLTRIPEERRGTTPLGLPPAVHRARQRQHQPHQLRLPGDAALGEDLPQVPPDRGLLAPRRRARTRSNASCSLMTVRTPLNMEGYANDRILSPSI